MGGDEAGGRAGRSVEDVALLSEVRQMCDEAAVTLRDHVEALLEAKAEATRVAADEREKAAQALREQLTERIASGDLNLREHIGQQVEQIRQMIESAERLELTRFSSISDRVTQLNDAGHSQIEQRISGVQREVALVQDAAKEAIAKAERATDERFRSVNEFRAQLADVIATFMPREVYQTAHDQLIARVAALERLSQIGEGRQRGIGVTAGVLVTVTSVAVAVIGLVVVLVNVLTSK